MNREMKETDTELAQTQQELAQMLQNLTTDDPKKAQELQNLLDLLQ